MRGLTKRRPLSPTYIQVQQGIIVNDSENFGRLLRNSLAALLLGATLVLLCYLFVDRPVAYFVHDQQKPDYVVLILKWLTYPPPILQAWTPVILVVLVVRRVYGPFFRWELAVLAACVSMVLADQFRETLGFAFGRYWPETWIDNNPSLIRDGAYGFHPFHGGSAYTSCPSGHTARTLAVAAVVWIAYPWWRWACVVGSVPVAVGLVGMNYHFVGDVIAGGFVGAIVGTYMTEFSGLGATHSPVPYPPTPKSEDISVTRRQ
jgi:membrane-associated phospholipid phosphatase